MVYRIKEICKAQGVTLKDVADRMGITDIALRKAISGNPTIKTLERIADALGVNVVELMIQPEETAIKCPHCGKPIYIKYEVKKGAEKQ